MRFEGNRILGEPELILRGRTPYLKSFKLKLKARAARNRVEFNHSITEMVAQKEGEMNKERDEKELRLVLIELSDWPTNRVVLTI